MIILKVTKKQAFTLSVEDTFLEKSQRGGGSGQIDSPSRSRVNFTKVEVALNSDADMFLFFEKGMRNEHF